MLCPRDINESKMYDFVCVFTLRAHYDIIIIIITTFRKIFRKSLEFENKWNGLYWSNRYWEGSCMMTVKETTIIQLIQ